jgi:hypothetical protein
VIYAIAFTVVARQFRGLPGTRGLLPVPGYLSGVSFLCKPSVFHLRWRQLRQTGAWWTRAPAGAYLEPAGIRGQARAGSDV